MRRVLVLATLLAAVDAHAQARPRIGKPPTMDLRHVAGTWIGVSSQVTNMNLDVEDLVDGNLDTAWNSRNGDLVGAWIDVHVAAGVDIASIGMTVGFTKVEADRDLFTANVRIKKVRVTHDGTLLYDKFLDISNRGIQELPIDATGGVVRIEVLEVVRGTNPTWDQTCVSELRVTGTTSSSGRQGSPRVVVGTQPPTQPPVQQWNDVSPCTALLNNDAISKQLLPSMISIDSAPLDADRTACIVEAARTDDAPEHEHSVFVVVGDKPKALLGKLLTFTTHHSSTSRTATTTLAQLNQTSTPPATTAFVVAGGDVELRAVSVSPKESALLVDHTRRLDGGGMADGTTESMLFRATKTGLVEVLRFDSKWTSKPNVIDICEIAIGGAHEPFVDLDIECTRTTNDLPPSDPDSAKPEHKKTTTRVQHFRWNGSKYAPL